MQITPMPRMNYSYLQNNNNKQNSKSVIPPLKPSSKGNNQVSFTGIKAEPNVNPILEIFKIASNKLKSQSTELESFFDEKTKTVDELSKNFINTLNSTSGEKGEEPISKIVQPMLLKKKPINQAPSSEQPPKVQEKSNPQTLDDIVFENPKEGTFTVPKRHSYCKTLPQTTSFNLILEGKSNILPLNLN